MFANKVIRFGLIGCGMIGSVHARALQRVSSAQLIAVTDAVPEYACAFAALNGFAWEEDYTRLLARRDIDAVIICTPSGLHAEHGMQAAMAGKHVLCEKPMDLSLERVDVLIAACRAQGVTLGGVFQNRFHASSQRLKRLIEAGALGELVFAQASCLWYRPQSYYDSSAWRGTWRIDGGVLTNQCIHTIDQLLWLTGQQPQVLHAYCPTLHREMEAEDLGVALLRFPNGAAGVVQGTTLASPGLPVSITLCGTRGSVRMEQQTITLLQISGLPDEIALPESNGVAGDPGAIPVDDHAANIADFVHAIQHGCEPAISGAEARKAVALIQDIYMSAEVGPWTPSADTSSMETK